MPQSSTLLASSSTTWLYFMSWSRKGISCTPEIFCFMLATVSAGVVSSCRELACLPQFVTLTLKSIFIVRANTGGNDPEDLEWETARDVACARGALQVSFTE